jgi:hypothetical protein
MRVVQLRAGGEWGWSQALLNQHLTSQSEL